MIFIPLSFTNSLHSVIMNASLLIKFFLLHLIYLLITADEKGKCRERYRPLRIGNRDDFAVVDGRLGDNIILDCHYCHEKDDESPKVWYKRDFLKDEMNEVELGMASNLSSNRIYVTMDHTLVIKNITREDSGLYLCYGSEGIGKELKYNYLLDIILSIRQLPHVGNITDWSYYHDHWLGPANNILTDLAESNASNIYGLNIKFDIFTDWEVWGPCVMCRKTVPQRRRLGVCRLRTIQYKKNDGTVPPYMKLLLNLSELSCHSHLIHNIIEAEFGITLWKIPDFVQIEECQSGEDVNDREELKVIMCHKEKAKIKPKIFLKYIVGTHKSITCPGASPLSVITWEKGKDKLGLEEYDRPLLVDSYGTLWFINPSRFESGNYTCFIDGAKIQEVWISFYTKKHFFEDLTLRYFLYILYVLSTSVICFCGGLFQVCRRKKYFPEVEEAEELIPYTIKFIPNLNANT